MLTEMVEYSHKIEEKVKAMKSEIKENVLGTYSDSCLLYTSDAADERK